ncbi:phospholipase D-like domain-containing protein [Qipengyuania sp. JC766]|uniref:phospholipase D-like domain-containing protein n=1 Tax=Qipengyuania sp. JC766 TaxID=3232139 RepID=UPI00345904DE
MAEGGQQLDESKGDEPFDGSVEPGVWRYVRADKLSVIVDAESYFELVQQAMLNARRRIMLVGWDFDTRIHLTQGRRWYQRPFKRREYPSRLGSFLLWLSNNRSDLDINLLKWGLSVFQFALRGSMAMDVARMWRKDRITFKFDTRHPVGCTHHQKLGVFDEKLAVCGGIDLTVDRWDTRAHLEKDRRRKRPSGRSYRPWHDITMMMEGEVADALGDLARSRWKAAGAPELEDLRPPDHSLWPDSLAVDMTDVEVGISRTRAEYGGLSRIQEVQTLMLAQIASAKRYIYIENQYFTSRRIAEAIAKRLQEPDPPEIVIVHAKHAEGWLEQQAMDYARSDLARSLREIDHKNRFSLYVAWTGDTWIYIHAKLMIVDDRILRIGSANLNNRSMGLDSECDMFVDCDRLHNRGRGFEKTIRDLRCSLLAEHCGVEPEEVGRLLEETDSMCETISRLGQSNSRQLRPFEIPELNEIEQTLSETELLDPESPEEMFEPFAKRGLFRKGSILRRARDKFRRIKK